MERKTNKLKKKKKKILSCYHCGSCDHRARECPTVTCTRCGQLGHDAGSEACPQKPIPPVDLGSFHPDNNPQNSSSSSSKHNNGSSDHHSCGSSLFTYCELFAGVGGFRVALDALGGRCVFASETDRFARINYQQNFAGDNNNNNNNNIPAGDICRIPASAVPDHDLLVGGFLCQPFSGSGKRRGLSDPKGGRGVLFREIVRILKEKRPKAFLLENVRGLLHHNEGRTLRTMVHELSLPVAARSCDCDDDYDYDDDDEGGGYYNVTFKVVDAVALLPQERKRLFLVGMSKTLNARAYEFPTIPHLHRGVKDILQEELLPPQKPQPQCNEKGSSSELQPNSSSSSSSNSSLSAALYLTPEQLQALALTPHQLGKVKAQSYTKRFPRARFLPRDPRLLQRTPSKTLQASYANYMVGSQFVPVFHNNNKEYEYKCDNANGDNESNRRRSPHHQQHHQQQQQGDRKEEGGYGDDNNGEDEDWRRFSSREAARLQGFPETFFLCRHRPYHLLGNAVPPPIVAMLAGTLLECIGIEIGCGNNQNDDDNNNNRTCSADCAVIDKSVNDFEDQEESKEIAMKTTENAAWTVTKELLLRAAPNDRRRDELFALLQKQSHNTIL